MPNHFETQTDVMGMDVNRGPTPEQLETIQRVSKRFHEDWELVPKTKQIRRRQRTWLRAARDLIWPRKHSVFAMYWWAKQLYAGKLDLNQSSYMPFEFPLKHDGMPIPGYPTKYQLTGWKIPQRDLRYLTHGPLADVGQHDKIIVDDKTTWDRIKELWVKLTWPFRILYGLMAIVVTIYGFYEIVLPLL